MINEPYDDEITYALAKAVAAEMNIPLNDVFVAFGEWWIVKTGQEKYVNSADPKLNMLIAFQ